MMDFSEEFLLYGRNMRLILERKLTGINLKVVLEDVKKILLGLKTITIR
jgi:hypothetical protein